MNSSFIAKNLHLVALTVCTAALLVVGAGIRGEQGLRGILYHTGQVEASSRPISIGVYDPKADFSNSSSVSIDQYFFNWSGYRRGELTDQYSYSAFHNRRIILTVEPFPDEARKGTLLEDVSAGRYDSNIDDVCADIADYGAPVLIRWGQEMDNIERGYPWATTNARGYVEAFRHFVSRCRVSAENAQYLWSPAGNQNLKAYWPGAEYVDYVGVSVFSYPQYDKAIYGKMRSFNDILSEKYGRVKGFKKPVIIAEMGVAGDADFQAKWMRDAVQLAAKYPLLRSAVYFNSVDSPDAWGKSYPTPDFRISQQSLSSFSAK